MSDGLERETLSYRELAARLGITPAAAKAKAKRRAAKGLWRLIAGNHPLDRVLVEVPSEDLSPHSEDQVKTIRAERSGTVATLVSELAEQRRRLAELDSLLHEAKNVLIAAHEKLIEKEMELGRVRGEVAAERRRAAEAVAAANARAMRILEEHRRDAAELTAAETREMGTKAELEQALTEIDHLARLLRRRRKPWWRRLLFTHAEAALRENG